MAARNLLEIATKTVEAIVASPRVTMYNVGITINPNRRRRQYVLYSTPRPWNHMVFLAYGLTLKQAQKLEAGLFDNCAKAAKTTHLSRKYSPVKEGDYRRSAGGRVDDDQTIYSIYVAWCGPAERY